MNSLTVFIGLICVVYGLYTFYARTKWPKQLYKLEPMKARWGKKTGTFIHIVAYSVVPIITGINIIRAGFYGLSLMNLITTN